MGFKFVSMGYNVYWSAWPVWPAEKSILACSKKMLFACAAFGHNAVGQRCLRVRVPILTNILASKDIGLSRLGWIIQTRIIGRGFTDIRSLLYFCDLIIISDLHHLLIYWYGNYKGSQRDHYSNVDCLKTFDMCQNDIFLKYKIEIALKFSFHPGVIFVFETIYTVHVLKGKNILFYIQLGMGFQNLGN